MTYDSTMKLYMERHVSQEAFHEHMDSKNFFPINFNIKLFPVLEQIHDYVKT